MTGRASRTPSTTADAAGDRAHPRRALTFAGQGSAAGFGLFTRWTDPFRLSVFLLAVITLSRIHQVLGLGALHPALLLAGFALLYAFLQPRVVAFQAGFQYWPIQVVLAIAIMALLSVPFGISLGNSASYIITNFSKVLIFAFLLSASLRSVSDLRLFFWAYVASNAALAYTAMFVFRLSRAAASYNYRLSNMYTYDANDAALVLMIGLPLTLLLAQTSRWRGRVIALGVAFATMLAIARSGSRGAFVTFAVVGLVFLLTLKQVRFTLRAALLAAIVGTLVVAAPRGYWEQMDTIIHPSNDYNLTSPTGRKQIAIRGIGYMMSHPVFGIGIDNFARAEGTISDLALRNQLSGKGVRWTAPHNTYIQIGSELGVVGLMLFLGLVFGGLIALQRLRGRLEGWDRGDPEQRFLHLTTRYLQLSMLAFAVGCTFLSFAYIDPIYVLAAYLTGTYAAVDRKLRELRG